MGEVGAAIVEKQLQYYAMLSILRIHETKFWQVFYKLIEHSYQPTC